MFSAKYATRLARLLAGKATSRSMTPWLDPGYLWLVGTVVIGMAVVLFLALRL